MQILAPAFGHNEDIVTKILEFLDASFHERFDPDCKPKAKAPNGFVRKHSRLSRKCAIGDVCQPSGGAPDPQSKRSRVCLPQQGGDQNKRDLGFRENVESAQQFVQKCKELPKSDGVRKEEIQLAKFLNNQRRSYTTGQLNEERRKLLKGVAGMKERLRQWDDPNNGFRENVKGLQGNLQKFKELPIRNGARKEETRLAMFLSHQSQVELSVGRLKLLEGVPHMKELVRSGTLARLEPGKEYVRCEYIRVSGMLGRPETGKQYV